MVVFDEPAIVRYCKWTRFEDDLQALLIQRSIHFEARLVSTAVVQNGISMLTHPFAQTVPPKSEICEPTYLIGVNANKHL